LPREKIGGFALRARTNNAALPSASAFAGQLVALLSLSGHGFRETVPLLSSAA
jgi:hypothetical protein